MAKLYTYYSYYNNLFITGKNGFIKNTSKVSINSNNTPILYICYLLNFYFWFCFKLPKYIHGYKSAKKPLN